MPKAWDWEIIGTHLFSQFFLQGAWTTLWLTVVAMLFGLVLGAIAGLAGMASNPLLRYPANFYVWVFRGTPLLIQLVMIFTALPQIGIRLGVVESAILGLAINEGAYLAEIFRAGILSIDRGQFEAARALGMPYSTAMRRVVLPQAARVVLPPLGNQFNGMLKATSLASVISMDELLRSTQYLIQLTFRSLELFTIACMYYLVLTTCWSLIQKRLEAHFGRSLAPTAAVPPEAQRRGLREAV